MRILVTVICLILIRSTAFAQQVGSNSQYLLNHLSINPAYTGYNKTLAANAFFRFQNLGIKDSPFTQTFNVHSPLMDESFSVGMQIQSQNVDVTSQTAILGSGAYRVGFSSMTLSMGLQGGIRIVDSDFSALRTRQPDDPAFSGNFRNINPSIGAGAMIYNESFYGGISINELIKNQDEFYNNQNIYLAAGYILKVGPEFQLKSNVLATFNNVEFSDINLNITGVFRDILGTGVAFQPGRTLTGLLQLFITDQFQLGYTYDVFLNDLSNGSSGSHEIGLQYLFKMPRRNVISPRLF